MNDILRKLLKDRGFVVCAVVLTVAALGIETVARTMKLQMRKLPVPLRKDLSEFDVGKMQSYRVVRKASLSAEVEEALGTTDYLQFILEDTSITDPREPGRRINFFVTYYTGDPSQVPHVPDVCYTGANYERRSSDNLTLDLTNIGLKNDTLPVRLVMFRNHTTTPPTDMPVIYFFSVNGVFKPDRTSVRLKLADLFQKYSYFSKVELAFVGPVQPTREQALRLGKKFLAQALPVLMQDHWADWNEVISRE